MKTRAAIKSHPIHAMVLPLPLGILTAAFGFDILGVVAGREDLWTTGGHLILAGLAAGVVAAVPGLVDYLRTVPPGSSARKRGTRHLLANVSALVLFAAAFLLRGEAAARPGAVPLLLEAGAMGLLAIGGWLGGTLVVRNFIGPEHRYAGAGRWREQDVPARPGAPLPVPGAADLEVDQMRLLHVGERRVALARAEVGLRAFDDACSHRGGSLADGVHMCGKVQCLWHGSQFDTATGAVRAGPATEPIRTHKIEEVAGEVRLTVD